MTLRQEQPEPTRTPRPVRRNKSIAASVPAVVSSPASTDRPLVADVAHAGLTVADLDDALVLWCDELGFSLERSFTLDADTTARTTGVHGATIRAATVTLGPHRVELLQYDPPRSAPASSTPAQAGVIHIALTVNDLDRVLGVCERHGWRAVGAPHRMAAGARIGTRIIYLEGEHGGFLEVIAPPAGARDPDVALPRTVARSASE